MFAVPYRTSGRSGKSELQAGYDIKGVINICLRLPLQLTTAAGRALTRNQNTSITPCMVKTNNERVSEETNVGFLFLPRQTTIRA